MDEVSVVICNKNNAAALKKLIPELQRQTYPPLQIIIIDDNSKDESRSYLATLNDSRVKVIEYQEAHTPGKKALLKNNIQRVNSPWVLMVDADCLPADERWVEVMMNKAIPENGEIVLGFGPYFTRPGWLNAIIRYEGLWVAWQYFYAAQQGWAYGGVGRNLLVKRSIFASVDWHEELASGDDDFLVQAADPGKVLVQTDPESFVYTDGPKTLFAWLKRKTRHTTTAYYLDWGIKVRLGFWHILLWYWWILVLVFWLCCPIIAHGIIILKILWVIFWLRPRVYRFNQDDLWCKSPFLEIGIGVLYLLVLPWSFWRDKKAWALF